MNKKRLICAAMIPLLSFMLISNNVTISGFADQVSLFYIGASFSSDTGHDTEAMLLNYLGLEANIDGELQFEIYEGERHNDGWDTEFMGWETEHEMNVWLAGLGEEARRETGIPLERVIEAQRMLGLSVEDVSLYYTNQDTEFMGWETEHEMNVWLAGLGEEARREIGIPLERVIEAQRALYFGWETEYVMNSWLANLDDEVRLELGIPLEFVTEARSALEFSSGEGSDYDFGWETEFFGWETEHEMNVWLAGLDEELQLALKIPPELITEAQLILDAEYTPYGYINWGPVFGWDTDLWATEEFMSLWLASISDEVVYTLDIPLEYVIEARDSNTREPQR